MEIKNQGKVYPSPFPSSSSSSSSSSSAMLKLLPAAILALVSVLSFDEREVLAYMITRSVKSSPLTSTNQDSKKKSTRKASINGGNANITTSNHNIPMFDCDCFSCYTSYWCRWDTSPNRELIHQAIEAFEEHLTNGEKPKKTAGRGKRREKPGRQGQAVEKPMIALPVQVQCPPLEVSRSEVSAAAAEFSVDIGGDVVGGSDIVDDSERNPVVDVAGDDQKGLATKVLPDVLGFFNSRLWSLWSPNL